MAGKVVPIRRKSAPAPRQLVGGSPGATYQPGPSTATPSFPTGGVIIVVLAVLIIVQLIGGDLTGRILSWYDHFKPTATASNVSTGALQPATAQQLGGPLGVGTFLPVNPGNVAPAPVQSGPLGKGLLLP